MVDLFHNRLNDKAFDLYGDCSLQGKLNVNVVHECVCVTVLSNMSLWDVWHRLM